MGEKGWACIVLVDVSDRNDMMVAKSEPTLLQCSVYIVSFCVLFCLMPIQKTFSQSGIQSPFHSLTLH